MALSKVEGVEMTDANESVGEQKKMKDVPFSSDLCTSIKTGSL